MANQTIALQENINTYIQENSLREPEILARLREETQQVGRLAVMQISPEQGQFMRLMVEMLKAKKILEVGCFTGYSALICALSLPDDGKIVTCDVSEEWTSIGKRYWEEAGVAGKIDLRLAPATETLQQMIDNGESGSFDMMFIDADKASYDQYYEQGLKLLRKGGLILLDNVLWGGAVADPSVTDGDTVAIRKINEKIHHDERVTNSLIPISDGVTLAYKR